MYSSVDRYTPVEESDTYVNSERIHNMIDSDILSVFFSKKNVDFIQNELINSVSKLTNGAFKIETQSYHELSIIMNFIFEQHSMDHQDVDLHLDFLNNKVIETCVPIIINNISMHISYVDDHINGEKWKNLMDYGTFTH